MPSQFKKLHPYRHFILWLISVAAVAFVGMWLFNVIATSEAGTTGAEPAQNKHATTDAETLAKTIKTRLENAFSNNTNLTFELTTATTPLKASDATHYVATKAPATLVSWEQSLGDEYSVYIRSQLQESIKDIMQNSLLMQQFDNGNATRLSYQNDTAICAADTVKKDDTISAFSVACIDKTKHQQLVTSIAPFAVLHAAAQPDQVTDTTVYQQLVITDSPVAGYQRAHLNTHTLETASGAQLLFYKSETGDWAFFTGTQQALKCSQFDTPALQSAFKGERCVDDESNEARAL